jgi:hypothetical protein
MKTVNGVAWKEPNINTFGGSIHAISPPPLLTVSQPPAFGSVIAWLSCHSGVFGFLSVLPMEKCFAYEVVFKRKVILPAEKTGNCTAGRKCKVSQACARHWRSTTT